MAKPVPVWHGSVDQQGRLHLQAKALFLSYCRSFMNQPVVLTLKKAARPKSQSQLGYLWGVLYPVLAEEFGYAGYELDALHDACVRRLRGLRPDPNPLQLRVSLAEMSHEQTSEYISDLRHWALTEHGIVTPDADQVEAPRE